MGLVRRQKEGEVSDDLVTRRGSSWADIPQPTQEEENEREREYRRAYRDGWVQAIDAMHDLMFQDRLSRQAAYDRCWEHLNGPLLEWLQQTPPLNSMQSPPEIPPAK